MVQRPRTGHELEPDRFAFASVKVPPDAVLPAPLRKLTAELRDHQAKHRAAQDKHRQLTSQDALRTAKQADAVLLGEAARAGKALPGPVNVEALQQAIEAEAHTMATHEAAGFLIAKDLDVQLRKAAATGATAERARIDDALAEHARALSALEDARRDLIVGTAGLSYWQAVDAGDNTRWRGRTDGGGASIVAPDGRHVPLENFGQLTTAITNEAARLAAAVAPPAGEAEAA